MRRLTNRGQPEAGGEVLTKQERQVLRRDAAELQKKMEEAKEEPIVE